MTSNAPIGSNYHGLIVSTLLCLLFSSLPSIQIAGELIVTNTNDSGANSLRNAIADADPGDVITFHEDLDGMEIVLTSGELVLSKSITIDGSSLPNEITISGDADLSNLPSEGDSRIFVVTEGTSVTLSNLNITRGLAPYGLDGDAGNPATPGENGGAIYNSGNLTIKNTDILFSQAGRGGEGFVDISGGNYSNGAAGGDGGAIFNEGTLSLEESTVYANRAGTGGIATNAISGNGGNGGGIYSTGSVNIVNSTVSENSGGSPGSVIRLGLHFAMGGNNGDGGGIYCGGMLTIMNSTFQENLPGFPSVFWVVPLGEDGSGGDIYVANENCVITINTSVIATKGFELIPSIDNLEGGTIQVTGTNLLSHNTTVEAEFPPPGQPGAPNSNGDIVGTAQAPIDSLLGPVSDNGGPTLTHQPLPNSPAINPVGGATTPPFPKDQRGLPRLSGRTVDIGAVEVVDNSALIAALNKKIKKLKKKIKLAKRKKQTAKTKRLKKKVRKLKQQLRTL